jgi:hypothetical protein
VAGRRPDGWGLRRCEMLVDHFENAAQISVDLIVPEPKDSKPLSLKMGIALAIFEGVRVEIVLAAVDFTSCGVIAVRS